MYPTNHAAALVDQLEAERAIAELMDYAIGLWLPLAQAHVLTAAGEPPPDPNGAADVEQQWNYLMETVVLFGIGLITANAIDRAFEAISGGLLAAGDAIASVAAAAAPQGLPSRDTLRAKVRSTLRRRISGFNPDTAESRLASVPALASAVGQHVDDVRTRLADMVGRVFRRVTGIGQEVPDAATARADTEAALNPGADEWTAVADETGQTQATAALNTAVVEAASLSGVRLEMQWVAIIDTHTRAAHAEADGQRRALGESFDVGGEDLRFPGDPLGSYDNTINCRCRIFASVIQNDLRADGGWCAPSADIYEMATSHADGTIDRDNEESSMEQFRSFTSVLAVIGEETDDGRMFATDIDLTFRDFPLPLRWQKQDSGGHYNAYTVGVIEDARVEGTQVLGSGYMLNTPEADEAMGEITHKVTGPSVDLGSVEWQLRDGSGNPIDWDDLWDDPDMKVVETVLGAKVLAATLVSTPAFGSTSITLGEMVERGDEALVAAAAMPEPGVDESVYDPAFFTDPQFSGPTLPHMTADGRIQGHLAAFNVCHIGIQDTCVMAPRSQTDYAWFHTSPPVKTTDGTRAKVGRLTVGGGHAGPRMGVGPAVAHYDDVGTAFALVHVGEDEYGIWFSGVAAPGATAQQIAQGLSAPLSGDWRRVGGNLELVAALAVNTPGFPIVASGATDSTDQPMSLVAAIGPCRDKADGPQLSEAQLTVFAKALVSELRAADRRDAEARDLLGRLNQSAAEFILKGLS